MPMGPSLKEGGSRSERRGLDKRARTGGLGLLASVWLGRLLVTIPVLRKLSELGCSKRECMSLQHYCARSRCWPCWASDAWHSGVMWVTHLLEYTLQCDFSVTT